MIWYAGLFNDKKTSSPANSRLNPIPCKGRTKNLNPNSLKAEPFKPKSCLKKIYNVVKSQYSNIQNCTIVYITVQQYPTSYKNTILVAPRSLAHHLQCCTSFKIQGGLESFLPLVFMHFRQLSLRKFLDLITPFMRKVYGSRNRKKANNDGNSGY